jgi:hypothetical protein
METIFFSFVLFEEKVVLEFVVTASGTMSTAVSKFIVFETVKLEL